MGRAGEGTVAENLTDAALALLGSNGPAITGLAMSRPAVAAQVRKALSDGAPSFSVVEGAIARYLEAEKGRGRVAAGTDSAAVALAIVGAAHHLLMTAWADAPEPAGRIRALVDVLAASTTPRDRVRFSADS